MEDQFFNYNNLEAYLNRMQLAYDGDWLRWVKDLINTKITMFHYDNLPGKKLTSTIVERALMFNNFLCAWKDPSGEVMMCKWRCGSVYDEYWLPEYVTLYTLTGKPLAYDVPYTDIVLLRDNPMDIVPFLTLNSWIQKIMEKEKTIDSIFDWVSLPVVFAGDKEQVASLKQLMGKSKKRTPFIVATKGYKDHLEQFDLKLPVDLNAVYDIMKKYRGMACASIGIYAVDEKRERIVTAEVQSQNDYVDFVYTGMYNERKRFVEECNARFGTNIVLRETYVENQEDNIDMAEDLAIAEEQGKVEVAEIKADADIKSAKIEAEATMQEAKSRKEVA